MPRQLHGECGPWAPIAHHESTLNNMTYHDPGNISTFAGVVVGSSAVSPWHVYAAAASGLWGRDHGGAAPRWWPDAQCRD